MCEKNTQTLIDTYFKSYDIKIHMEGNKEIFENDFPDGWIITNKQLFIIEAKQRKIKRIHENHENQTES